LIFIITNLFKHEIHMNQNTRER